MVASWPAGPAFLYGGRVTSTTDSRTRWGGALAPVLRAPWTRRAWLDTVHVTVGMPIGVAAFVVIVTLAAVAVSLAVTAIFVVVPLALLLLSNRVLTAVQRSRFAALLDVHIPPLPRDPAASTWLRRLVAETRSGRTWRQVGYHLLSVVTGTAGMVLVVSAWSLGLTFGTAFAHAWRPGNSLFGWTLADPVTLTVLTAVGVALFFAAPWVARGAALVDVALARALLGPSRSDELGQQVQALERSRAGIVDAADAERRRIERDLHDGAQQRLVSLAMNLGMARAKTADAPEAARQAIVQAHEEAKQALAELRDFVRGLHPAVLDDRGLDAALSGLAARSPVPVRLRVEVDRRPSPTIEAVAYFVVAESLTNVAKHAGASRVDVDVTRHGDRLRIAVTDDGRGGARADGGTGLRGLGQRVASVDGTLTIDSPPGGPTLIAVDLPCES
jgi:signal transduction histidine kinase